MMVMRSGLCAVLGLAAALGAAPLGQSYAQAPDLPQTGPAPQSNPRSGDDQPAASDQTPSSEAPASDLPDEATVPTDSPAENQDEQEQALPATPPKPDKRPVDGTLLQAEPAPVEPPAPETQAPAEAEPKPAGPPHGPIRSNGARPEQGPPVPASLVGAMPESERLCRAELKTLGVVFEARDAESDENGCSMPYPLSVESFGGGIKVEPSVIDNCAITLAAAKFLQTTVKDAARTHLNAELTGIANGSGYVCRPRHGTQRLSEHALGNALDIMSFTFSGDRTIVVEKTDDKAEAAFLDAVHKAACGPFKTVLGPGSDADHANHFHLDLAERRNGSTFCQ